eukprot:1139694-Pelagomonas_calceolata.AAC.2
MLGPMVMKEVSRQAAEQGFDDRSSRSGRLTNVLVATHSASGLYFGDAAVKHAGVCVHTWDAAESMQRWLVGCACGVLFSGLEA